MYLKSITLQGFKSFPQKTEITFNKGVTAIVGPNGCGKSNIADAVQWVLGEQSIKALRGQKSEDIIFSGTDKRRPLHFAQVSIKFDNEDGSLPVKFPEVEVTRRVFRHGENEYLINGQQVRLKDVRQLFMDTGFGKDGYAIVGQGQIDAILSASAKDRKHLFDEAAGISRVKYEKEEAQRNLERLDQQLVRISDMHHATERFVERLHEEAVQAKAYLQLFQETKEAVVQYNFRRVQVLQKRIEECDKALEEIRETLEQMAQEQQNLEKTIAQAERDLIQKEADLKVLQENYYDKTAEVEKLRGQQNVTLAEQVRLEREEHGLEDRLAALEQRYDTWKNEEVYRIPESKEEPLLDELKTELTEWQNKLAEQESLLKKRQEQLRAAQNKQQEAMELALQQKLNLELSEQQKAELRKTILEVEETKKTLEAQLEEQKIAIEKGDENLADLRVILQRETSNLAETTKQQSALQDSIQQIQESLLRLRSDLGTVQAKLRVMANAREHYESYGKSVQELMWAINKEDYGIHNTVAELIHVEEPYTKALETVLGLGMQNIVIDQAEKIQGLIRLAKQKRWGRVTFLPLDTIKAKIQRAPNPLPEGCLGLAVDLVKTDKQYDHILAHLLRNTLVFDNYVNALNFAKNVKFDRRFVTLQGEVIYAGGAVSIGEAKQKSSLLGEKKRWQSMVKEEQNLLATLQQEQALWQKNQSALADETTSMAVLQEKVEDVKAQIQSLSQILWERELQKKQISGELDELKTREESLKEKLKYWTHPEETENQIAEDTDSTAVEQLEADIVRLETYIQTLREEHIMKQKAYYDAREAAQARRFAKEQYRAEGQHLQGEKEQVQDALASVARAKQDNEVRKLEQTSALDAAEKSYDACRREFSAMQDDIYTHRIRLKEDQALMRDLDETRHSQSLEQVNWLNKLENWQVEENRLVAHVEEVYGVHLKDWKDTGQEVTQRKKKELETALQEFGAVNVSSIHQYESEKEQFEKLQTQRQDLIQSKVKLETLVATMEEEMEKRFQESLSSINEHFNRVFVQLFEGGHAELIYRQEDGEDAVHILAEPPGKKLQHLNLLSGGEKALTAVALIFALFHERPSPFSILDEIDAALDDANIARYTEYIASLSQGTQFIMITHRRGTMELAETIYGVTMEQKGISKVIPLEMSKYLKEGSHV